MANAYGLPFLGWLMPGRINGIGVCDPKFWAQMCLPNLLVISIVLQKKNLKIRGQTWDLPKCAMETNQNLMCAWERS